MCKRPAGPAGLLVLAAVIALSMLAPLAGSPSPARADGTYRAGVAQITVQDAVSGVVGFGDAQMLPVPFEVLVAYPTDAAEAPFEAGPFTIHASLDAPIAPAKAFPVLLFSHGNGRGGSPLHERDLITSLARQGFIVIAPFHSGTRPLRDRPRQLHKALDQVLADQRFAAQADRSRLGIVGYSFGGAVALIAAGATPDFAHLVSYCRGAPTIRAPVTASTRLTPRTPSSGKPPTCSR
jgi:predicted dienelactone hydrolase